MSSAVVNHSALSKGKIALGLLCGGIYYAANFGFFVLVSRLAPSPHDFGIFVSAIAMLKSFSLIVGAGFDAVALSKGYEYFQQRRVGLLRALQRVHLVWLLGLGGLLALLALLHWKFHENFYAVPEDVDAFFLAGWAAAALSLKMAQIALLTGCDRPILATVIDRVVTGLFTLVIGITLLWFFQAQHAVWAIGGVVLSNALLAMASYALLSFIFDRVAPSESLPAEKPPLQQWVRMGLLQSLMMLLSVQVPPLFIAVARLDRQDLALVGAFGALFATAAIVLVPFSGLRHLIHHRFDRLIFERRRQELWTDLRKVIGGVLTLSVGFAVVAVMLGPRILAAFGPSFAVYDWELAQICLGLGLLEAAKTTSLVATRTENSGRVARAALAFLPIGLLVTGWFSLQDQIAGMAGGFLLFAVLLFASVLVIARRITEQWPTMSPSGS